MSVRRKGIRRISGIIGLIGKTEELDLENKYPRTKESYKANPTDRS